MEDLATNSAIGLGVYSVGEASRLTGISPQRLRRWLFGYKYQSDAGIRHLDAVFPCDYAEPGQFQLSFLDLIEARVIDSFIRYGVSWKELRRASHNAAQLLQTAHPFATFEFKTDGKQIFAEIINLNDKELVSLKDKQHVFHRIVSPSLKNLEFDEMEKYAARWWPIGKNKSIVLDPKRSFGKPIGNESGVPTKVLAAQVAASSIKDVSEWYRVKPSEIKNAIVFESSVAA